MDDRVQQAADKISERMGTIKAMMASLTSLHQISRKLTHQDILLFSTDLSHHADYVTSIGRYENLNQSDRAAFEAKMRKNSFDDFTLRQINDNGILSERGQRNSYHPISILGTASESNTRLLGADLSSIPELGESLDAIAQSNASLLTSLPESWRTDGDLFLFRPVYQELQPIANIQNNNGQPNGGYFVGVRISTLLKGIESELTDTHITVDLSANDSVTPLYERSAELNTTPLLHKLYSSQRSTEIWTTNAGALIVNFQKEFGYTPKALMVSVMAFIVLMSVSFLISSQVISRQLAAAEQRRAREALFEEREKAENTLNSMQDAIVTLDTNLHVVHINPAAVLQFNTKPVDAIGEPVDNIIQFQPLNDEFTEFNLDSALRNLERGGSDEFDVVPLGHSHADFIIRLALTSTRNFDGQVTGHIMVMRDISHEHKLTQKLAYQAHHDVLTGCSNRFHFEHILAGLIDELPINKRQHALCYMDLDQFKIVNDTCGHRAGDSLLRELTQNMKAIIREGDVLSRLGGDEFGLLMLNVNEKQTRAIASRFFDFFQNYIFQHEDKAFAIRASIGVVCIDSSCNNIKDVMAAADIACYAAKDSGRNSMYFFSSDDDTISERSEELSWLPRLQSALQNNEFRLHLQAVAAVSSNSNKSISSGHVNHFEFLLRLANDDGTECTPWQFVQAAERYDLMRDIDRWVIHNALRTISELKNSARGQCSYSINLSGQSTADPTLKIFIKEQIRHYDIDPAQIWFELTETAAISHFSIAIDLINNIRDFGAKIALDDFGSGLSSFGYLKTLPVDIIKIDGQFVKEMANNPIDREMVRAIHQVGKSMGIVTVAEFVESQEILDALITIGVDYAQGYHIGKPCPVAIAIGQLEENQKAA